jgi:hypothetical protein
MINWLLCKVFKRHTWKYIRHYYRCKGCGILRFKVDPQTHIYSRKELTSCTPYDNGVKTYLNTFTTTENSNPEPQIITMLIPDRKE